MHKKQNGDFLISKYNSTYHNGLIDKQSGAFKQIQWEFSVSPYAILSFREYKGKYLISFMFNGSIHISENGKEIFKFHETVKQTYPVTSGYNFTRIVDLKDDRLYFIDASDKLNRVDLAELLSLTDKSKYRATVLTSTAIVDFCVSAEHTVTTVTQSGILTNLKTGQSVTVDSTNRGTMRFTSIEQLGAKIVTEGFNESAKQKYYIVYDAALNELASAAVGGDSSVHNMELFERDGRLWILAANHYKTVDCLVLNSDELALVQTLEVNSKGDRTYGLIWKEVGEEAIVYGYSSWIRSFKL